MTSQLWRGNRFVMSNLTERRLSCSHGAGHYTAGPDDERGFVLRTCQLCSGNTEIRLWVASMYSEIPTAAPEVWLTLAEVGELFADYEERWVPKDPPPPPPRTRVQCLELRFHRFVELCLDKRGESKLLLA